MMLNSFDQAFLTLITIRRVEKAIAEKGGAGSGNFGHAGRPGEVGGSLPAGGEAHSSKEISALRSEISQWDGARRYVAKHVIEEAKNGMPLRMIKDGGEIKAIATVDLKWGLKKDSIYVNYLATKEGGYGGKMMAQIAKMASAEKKGLSLTSLPKAVGFYEALGFQRLSAAKLEYYLSPKQTKMLSRKYTAKADITEEDLAALEPDDGVFCRLYDEADNKKEEKNADTKTKGK
jgi:hypothetical protein